MPAEFALADPVAAEEAVDLGVVDFVEVRDQHFGQSGVAYRFQAARDGIVAATLRGQRVLSDGPYHYHATMEEWADVHLYECLDSGELVEVASGWNPGIFSTMVFVRGPHIYSHGKVPW